MGLTTQPIRLCLDDAGGVALHTDPQLLTQIEGLGVGETKLSG